jgi:hypothetical protein
MQLRYVRLAVRFTTGYRHRYGHRRKANSDLKHNQIPRKVVERKQVKVDELEVIMSLVIFFRLNLNFSFINVLA